MGKVNELKVEIRELKGQLQPLQRTFKTLVEGEARRANVKLVEAHQRMHHAAASAAGPASTHAASPGARASRGPEPAPRSQGPRGRKARRHHRNHG